MLEVREALYEKLTSSSTVTSLLSSSTAVYHLQAPKDAEYPLIIISKSSGIPTYAFSDLALEQETWQVKAVDRNTTSTPAESISEAVDAVLTNGVLNLDDYTLADIRRTSDIDYIETNNGETFRHHGSLYRLTIL